MSLDNIGDATIDELILLHLDDPRTLTAICPTVCKRWRDILATASFWIEKCLFNGVSLPSRAHRSLLSVTDYRRIWIRRPFNRNLVVNPSGEDNFNGWKIVKDGGHRYFNYIYMTIVFIF